VEKEGEIRKKAKRRAVSQLKINSPKSNKKGNSLLIKNRNINNPVPTQIEIDIKPILKFN